MAPQDSALPLGLGAVIYDEGFQDSIFSNDPQILKGFRERRTMITPLEAAAVVGALYTWSNRIRNKLVICFVDNSPACAALAKGSSTQEDLQCLSTLTHRMLCGIGAKVWFEWLPSACNASDSVSRGRGPLDTGPMLFPKW
eukprot:12404310-Karenia_brevis.AAC.1